MNCSHEEFLIHFGWNDFFENQLAEFYTINPGKIPGKLRVARVINEEKNLYRLQFNSNEILWSSIPGKMQFTAQGRKDLPAIGDWVLAEVPDQSERAIIRHIFIRKTMLMRKQVGSASDIQILSTNVDTVFITTSLNGDLNLGRLERYLTFVLESKARPVILLTKSDLYLSDLQEVIDDLRLRFIGVEIHSLTKDCFEEAHFLKKYLGSGTTSVLVGSSGVGKSTISNFLIGREEILTTEVRESDGKGRHTTTSRSLYQTIYGGLIIDTPGIRELQFAGYLEGLETQFADIEKLIGFCRYNDCEHVTEVDCAVKSAIEDGSLDASRWKSYKKIAGEIRHGMRKENKWMLAIDRKVWKKRSIEARGKHKGWR
jgi:ribosome biogenesis GTPase